MSVEVVQLGDLVIVICFRSFLYGIMLVGILTTSGFALPYSEVVFFGDSLSDVGNVSQRTDLAFLIPRIPADQTDAYYMGRFSDGPVWADYFSDLLGLGPVTHSYDGGKDYAHGNAMTTGTGWLLSSVIDDIDDQVADYLGTSPTIASDSLFVIFAGANDLLDEEAAILAGDPVNVTQPVNSLVDDINDLISHGAQKLVVANLPRLGLTPRYNGDPNEAASFNAVTESFNQALWSALDAVDANAPAVDLFRLDVEQLIDDAVSNPAAFGLVNVTDSAAPGLTYSTTNYNSSLIVPQPDTYLFWDDLHPTTAAHALLASYAFDTVTYSADFDFDGDVDSLDRVAWEASYGVDSLADANDDGLSSAEDFFIWQRQYGSGITAFTATFHTVPEPGALGLVACLALGIITSRGRKLGDIIQVEAGT